MASKMLGIEVADGSQEAIDAVGEVCNMIAGNFKNKIAGLGDGCQLSLPTVICGANYSLRTFASERTVERQLLFEGFPLLVSLEITN
jgi:chemotaxis protein CheX